MKRAYLTYLILMIIFVIAGMIPARATLASDQPMVWKGSVSAQKEPFIKVVENQKEWSDLWTRALGGSAPAVNFEKYVVACVFLGNDARWLYSIFIDEPVRRGDVWVIPYGLVEMILELSGPFKASGQYQMKVYEKKKDGVMILEADPRSSGRL